MRKMMGTGSESRGRFSIALPAALAGVLLVGACGTFDNMSSGGKGATSGAGVGYVGGAALGND